MGFLLSSPPSQKKRAGHCKHAARPVTLLKMDHIRTKDVRTSNGTYICTTTLEEQNAQIAVYFG